MFSFIHKRIPRKSLLHRFLPAKCTTPICSLCNIVVDSADRFIFTCPPKLAVWQDVICEFLWPTVDMQGISNVFPTLDFYPNNYCQNKTITANMVLITTLSFIWKAHWSSIFNGQSFLPNKILQNIS